MPSILRFVAISLIMLLTACGGPPTTSSAPQPTQPAAPTQPPEPTAAPQPTQPPQRTATPEVQVVKVTPEATSQTTSIQGDVLVVLHVTGGIAGVDDTLTVYPDGRIELNDRSGKKAAQVAPSELATLQKLLASPEFAALAPQYQAVVSDAFIYELKVSSGSQHRTIVTMDGAQTPEVLKQVLMELNRLRKLAR